MSQPLEPPTSRKPGFEFLPELVDDLADAIVVTDRRRRVIAANRAYRRAFGSSPSPAALECSESRHCTGYDDPNGEPCSACHVFATGQSLVKAWIVRNMDGSHGEWEASFSPIHGGGEVVTHVVEVWRDIRDRRALEAQLAHGERLASIGLLAAGVGHEINNPLASVMAAAESLSRTCERLALGPEDRLEVQELTNTVHAGIERCHEITTKLMLLAKPASTARSPVDLNRAVSDTLSLLSFQTRAQGIQVIAKLERELPAVWGHESALRGLCMNLMLNAVQAMTRGGTLTVSTRREDHHVTFEVLDTGPGVPLEVADRIWDAFFSTKPVGQGTGLGLSVARGIVANHGGSLRLESPAEGGARFVVDLPAGAAEGHDA